MGDHMFHSCQLLKYYRPAFLMRIQLICQVVKLTKYFQRIDPLFLWINMHSSVEAIRDNTFHVLVKWFTFSFSRFHFVFSLYEHRQNFFMFYWISFNCSLLSLASLCSFLSLSLANRGMVGLIICFSQNSQSHQITQIFYNYKLGLFSNIRIRMWTQKIAKGRTTSKMFAQLWEHYPSV